MPIQLVITIEDNGAVNVQGPIKDKLRAYGMLEVAKDAINEFHAQQAARVTVPTPAEVAAIVEP